jgi:hypothetical protein
MADDDTKKDENAELRARIAALEAKIDPPKSTFVPESDEAFRARMHDMAEKRMSMAMPPAVVNYFADGLTAADRADLARVARAPSGPTSAIPGSQQSGGSGPSTTATPGWSEPRPLTTPPGTFWVDAQMIADDVRQRKERK